MLGAIMGGLGIMQSIQGHKDMKAAEAEQRKMQAMALSSLNMGMQDARPLYEQGITFVDSAAAQLAKRHDKARNMLGASAAANEAMTARLMAQGVANSMQGLVSSGFGGSTMAAGAGAQVARQVAADATGRSAAQGQVQASQEAAFAGQEFTANVNRAEARTNFANFLYGHGERKSNIYANTQIQGPAPSTLLPALFASAGAAGGFGKLFGFGGETQ